MYVKGNGCSLRIAGQVDKAVTKACSNCGIVWHGKQRKKGNAGYTQARLTEEKQLVHGQQLELVNVWEFVMF